MRAFNAPALLTGTMMLVSLQSAADAAASMTISSLSIPVNGKADVTISGAPSPSGATDWVGLYEDSATPSGNPPSIWWANLLDAGVTDGNGTFTFDPAGILSAQQSRYIAGNSYKFIVAYNGGYAVSAKVTFGVTVAQSPLIASFDQVVVTTKAGTAPVLPSAVTANTGANVSVTWDSISPSQYAKAGSFTVKGHAAGTGVVAKASVTVNEGSGPVLRFSVISDVHIRSSSLLDTYSVHFQEALDDMNAIRAVTPLAALCIDGDFTDDGSTANYTNFNNILKGTSHPAAYYAIGNHEIQYCSNYDTALTHFLNGTGMPRVYCDTTINGYDFIFLGSESGTTITFNLTTTQLNWLESKLAAVDKTGKTAFVFIHEPVTNTVAGSDSMHDLAQSAQLQAILSNHLNSILFTGHTHCIETSSNEFYNASSHYVNTGAVAYLWYGPTWTGCGGSQGLYVDVYDDKVVIKCREFDRNEWLVPGPGGGQETIAIPSVSVNGSAQKNSTMYAMTSVKVSRCKATFFFSLARQNTVTLNIHDLSGKIVAVPLMNRQLPAGLHKASWNAGNRAAGFYFAAIHTGDGTENVLEKFCIVP